MIDPNFKGKAYGPFLVDNGVRFLSGYRPEVEKVYGFVLPENTASIRIFEKLGYKKIPHEGTELKFEKNLK